ncbi:hypothetical protein GCM10023238_06000 [Streptomyces heliomycini]
MRCDAEFLLDLAYTGLPRRLTFFDVAPWDVAVVLVGRLDEEDPIGFVEEESAAAMRGRAIFASCSFSLTVRTLAARDDAQSAGQICHGMGRAGPWCHVSSR